jgi:hypothetical protein
VAEARTHVAEIGRLAPGLLESRLGGRTYFADPSTTERYRQALQLAVSTEPRPAPAKAGRGLTAREGRGRFQQSTDCRPPCAQRAHGKTPCRKYLDEIGTTDPCRGSCRGGPSRDAWSTVAGNVADQSIPSPHASAVSCRVATFARTQVSRDGASI